MNSPNCRWKLRCGARTYTVVQRWDLRAGEAERIWPYTPGLLRSALADPLSCRTLYRIRASVGLCEPDSRMQDSGSRVMLDLEPRFRRGQLVLLLEAPWLGGCGGTGTEATAPRPPAPRPEKKKEKTWIEIVLMDERKQPVPFEAYVLTLPCGYERRGSLDEDGKAYISGIDPGTCSVSFPYIHGEEWWPV